MPRKEVRTMAPVRRIATTTALVLFTSLSLTSYAGPPAFASSKPPPTDPGQHQTNRLKIAEPDHRRNPGLKAVLSEKDADRGIEDPSLSALCQAGVGKPNPYRNPFAERRSDRRRHDRHRRDRQAGCSSAQNENTIAVNPENPTQPRRRRQRLPACSTAVSSATTPRAGRTPRFDGGKTWTNVQLPHLTFQTGGTGAFALDGLRR